MKGQFITTNIFDFINESIKTNGSFNKWFSDSKVVDTNGKPIIVYHTTNKNFRVFNFKNALQKIIWFTTDINAIRNKEIGASGYKFIKEFYVRINNPCGWSEYNKYGLGQLKELGYDGCILKNNDGTFTGFAFHPNQIKSVDNDGSFDIDDNNIYS